MNKVQRKNMVSVSHIPSSQPYVVEYISKYTCKCIANSINIIFRDVTHKPFGPGTGHLNSSTSFV